jgi:hypothetical protein
MIGIGTVLALLFLFQRKDPFYALVVDWAVLGILIKRASDSRASVQGIVITSIICISIITIAVLIQIIRRQVYS